METDPSATCGAPQAWLTPPQVQMKMAAEVSRRSEDDRRRKLQLQEEADLAYAIALSKAEAASLKSQ